MVLNVKIQSSFCKTMKKSGKKTNNVQNFGRTSYVFKNSEKKFKD